MPLGLARRLPGRLAAAEVSLLFGLSPAAHRDWVFYDEGGIIPDFAGRLRWLPNGQPPTYRPIRCMRAIDPIVGHATKHPGGRFLFALGQRARSGRWVAIFAAYLLVLQAVFAGLTSGAHAASMSLDRSLGMTLCAPGEMPAGAASDTSAANHDLMVCCTLASAGSSGGEPAKAADYVPVIHRTIDLIAFARHLDAPHAYVAGRSPASPRGPPSEV